jgi:hypothetical protein
VNSISCAVCAQMFPNLYAGLSSKHIFTFVCGCEQSYSCIGHPGGIQTLLCFVSCQCLGIQACLLVLVSHV